MKSLIIFALILGFNAQGAPSKSKNTPPKTDNLVLSMTGKIYPKDTFPESCKDLLKGVPCNEKSYGLFHVDTKREGDLNHAIGTFSDPEKVQLTEESWEKDGHVQRAIITNNLLKKRSELEVKGNKVFYKVTDLEDGSVKTSEEDWVENLVVPSTLMSYVRPSFAKLQAGEDVEIRMAVLDRRERFKFTISKARVDQTPSGESLLVLKMKPNSIIVQALVETIYFYVKAKTGEMYAFEGESALRKKVGDDYKKISVRTAYEVLVDRYNEQAKNTKKDDCDADALILGKGMKCEVKAHE